MNHTLFQRPWVVVTILAAVTLALLAPSQPWKLAIGHPTSDLSDHYQGMWWFGGEILAGRWPSVSAVTHFPTAPQLWFPDPIGGLLALPLRPLGPVLSYNGVIFLQLWLGGLCTWAMARHLGARPVGALLAGLFLTTSPFLLGLTHSGITEGLGLAPVVLFVWALFHAMGRGPGQEPRPWWVFLWPGLALILVGLQSPTYLVGGLLLAGCSALGCFSMLLPRLKVLAGLTAVATAPMLLLRSMVTGTLGETGVVRDGLAPGWRFEGLPATDLLGFFRPGPHYFPDTPALGNPGVLHVYYLGWVALAISFLGWRKAPWLRLPLLLMALLCLGPSLCINGEHLPSLDAPFLLPFSLLYSGPSPFDFIHHPYRMVAVLLPLLALLVAHGATSLSGPWAPMLGALMMVEALLISPAPWPLAATDTTPPAIYAELPPGPVMDWPPDATDWNRRYLRWQVGHGHEIAYGVNTGLPDAARHDPILWTRFLRLTHPGQRLVNRDLPGRTPHPSTTPTALSQQGYTSLLLHTEPLSDSERSGTIRALQLAHGPPLSEDEDHVLWALGQP